MKQWNCLKPSQVMEPIKRPQKNWKYEISKLGLFSYANFGGWKIETLSKEE
jgi:hypothetical protein